jgi:hypothetical protein
LRIAFLSVVLCFVVASPYFAQESYTDTHPLSEGQYFRPDLYGAGWLTDDRDGDGVIDYAILLDERWYRVQEAMDFNFDGAMDDFYFYANDVLQRQEIDSNYDGQIDIWVYLYHGVYIRMWERDTDFDGVIDVRRDYDHREADR